MLVRHNCYTVKYNINIGDDVFYSYTNGNKRFYVPAKIVAIHKLRLTLSLTTKSGVSMVVGNIKPTNIRLINHAA